MVDLVAGIKDFVVNKGAEYISAGAGMLSQGVMSQVHQNPALLDDVMGTAPGTAQDFYRALGPSGQENLKGIIAQDANFLPALNKAMEGDGASSQFSKMPAGLVNVVLAEANQDPKFRTQLTDALQNDPSKVMEVVGKEAGQDTQFGMKLGAEGFKSAISGEMDMGGMGGALKGMLGGMLGGLMENMGEFFKQFMGMFAQLFGSIMGFFGGDKLMQSVGDKPPGDRPVDQMNALAHEIQVQLGMKDEPGRVFVTDKDGTREYRDGNLVVDPNAKIRVSEETMLKDQQAIAAAKDPTIKDPSQAMMAGPR